MPKIHNLKIENFKSFKNLDFELNDLNIMIGRNGSGKSNLLSFFRLLQRASEERLVTSMNIAGGFDEMRWRYSDPTDTLEWQVKFDELDNADETITYAVAVGKRGNGFSIRSEEVSFPPTGNHTTGFKLLGVYDGHIRYLSSKGNVKSTQNGGESVPEGNYLNDRELAVSQIRDPLQYPAINELQQILSDWTIFRGFGENAFENIYNSQSLDVVSPLRLDADGDNLISVLHHIENESKYNAVREELSALLKDAFPDFVRLSYSITATGKAELRWWEQNRNKTVSFPASSVSDGMLRFLGLATLLLLPDPPALIAIDEPEIGLHPRLIPLLAELLKDASTRTQVIVATHSPQLLNAQAIEAEDVVIVEKDDGETKLDRKSSDDLRIWLEDYSLGHLWTMGVLDR